MLEAFAILNFFATLALAFALFKAIGGIKAVHVLVNSRLSQLLLVVGESREAIGVRKAEERAKGQVAEGPLPVTDHRTATAAEDTADSTRSIADDTKRSADANVRLADIAEKESKP